MGSIKSLIIDAQEQEEALGHPAYIEPGSRKLFPEWADSAQQRLVEDLLETYSPFATLNS
jgi:hypothetical protein